MQEPGAACIDRETERGDHNQRSLADGLWREQSLIGLKEDDERKAHEHAGIDERHENAGAMVAIGLAGMSRTQRESQRIPAQSQCDHIAQIVYGIRDKREAVSQNAGGRLGQHESHGDGERGQHVLRGGLRVRVHRQLFLARFSLCLTQQVLDTIALLD